MSQELRRINFIGLGRMGSAMARSCLKAGFELSVYNRTAARTKPLVDEGAAGDADGIARCEPLFRAYSQAAVRVAADHAVANSLEIAVSCMGASMLELMLQASGDTRVAFSHAGIIRDKLLATIAHGLGGKDWSASCEVARMNAGLKSRGDTVAAGQMRARPSRARGG